MPVEFIDRFLEQDLSVADLELEARTNEGFIIRSIEAESAEIDAVIRVIIQDTTMLNIPIATTGIGLLPIVNRTTAMRLFFDELRKKYPDVPLLKVTEGEKFVITAPDSIGKARINFVQLTGAEIPSPSLDGGSLGKNKLFVSHSKKQLTIALSATEIKTLDVSVNPAGMFEFPFGEVAPANYIFELLGFSIFYLSKHADITVDGLRIWHIDKSILARDEAFVPIESFPYLPNNKDNKMFLLSDKEIIRAGDELKIEVQATNVNVAAQTVDMYCTMIFIQRKAV